PFVDNDMLQAFRRALLCASNCFGGHINKRWYPRRGTWVLNPPQPYQLQMDFSTPLAIINFDDGYRAVQNLFDNLTDLQKSRLDCLRVQLELLKPYASESFCLPDCDKIFDKQWLELLACKNSRSLDRQLFKIYRLQIAHSKDPLANVETEHGAVPLWCIRDCSAFYNYRLQSELQFCDRLIIDLAFDSIMSPKSLASFVHEFRHAIRFNRESRQPFRLHLCGPRLAGSAQSKSLFRMLFPGGFKSREDWEKGMLAVMNEQSLYDMSDGCFSTLLTNIDDVVYIVPGSRNRLNAYDPQKTYVLPGYAYRLTEMQSAAVQRAKSLGLKCYSLPWNVDPRLFKFMQAMLAFKNRRFFVE
ncbi:hypothetical protein BOX15_Mlig016274g7, partial [Macrostomum lignano]